MIKRRASVFFTYMEWKDVNLDEWMERRQNKEKLYSKLLRNIKKKLPELIKLLEQMNGTWNQEDSVYRFYHHSFKTYYIQSDTERMVKLLKSIAPDDYSLNYDFLQIIYKGTGKKFKLSHNRHWHQRTTPLLLAFYCSKYFIEMMVKYSDLKRIPQVLPSGVAAILYLYNLR